MSYKSHTLLEYLVSLDTELAKLKKIVAESVGSDYSELITNINSIRNELNTFKTSITNTINSNNNAITSQVNTLTSQFNTFKSSLETQVEELSSITTNIEQRVTTLESNSGSTGGNVSQVDTIVDKSIVDGILNLGTEKYQKCTIEDLTQINLPTVTSFTEIHLFFSTSEALTLVLPSCKWQFQPTIEANKDYEFIFTFTDRWLGGCIIYE